MEAVSASLAPLELCRREEIYLKSRGYENHPELLDDVLMKEEGGIVSLAFLDIVEGPKLYQISSQSFRTLLDCAKKYPLEPTASPIDVFMYEFVKTVESIENELDKKSVAFEGWVEPLLSEIKGLFSIWSFKVTAFCLAKTRGLNWRDVRAKEAFIYDKEDGSSHSFGIAGCCAFLRDTAKILSEAEIRPVIKQYGERQRINKDRIERMNRLKHTELEYLGQLRNKLVHIIEAAVECVKTAESMEFLIDAPLKLLFKHEICLTRAFVKDYIKKFYKIVGYREHQKCHIIKVKYFFELIKELNRVEENEFDDSKIVALLVTMHNNLNNQVNRAELAYIDREILEERMNTSEGALKVNLPPRERTKKEFLSQLTMMQNDFDCYQMFFSQIFSFFARFTMYRYKGFEVDIVERLNNIMMLKEIFFEIKLPEISEPWLHDLFSFEIEDDRRIFSDTAESWIRSIIHKNGEIGLVDLIQFFLSIDGFCEMEIDYHNIVDDKVSALKTDLQRLYKISPDKAQACLDEIKEKGLLNRLSIMEDILANVHLIFFPGSRKVFNKTQILLDELELIVKPLPVACVKKKSNDFKKRPPKKKGLKPVVDQVEDAKVATRDIATGVREEVCGGSGEGCAAGAGVDPTPDVDESEDWRACIEKAREESRLKGFMKKATVTEDASADPPPLQVSSRRLELAQVVLDHRKGRTLEAELLRRGAVFVRQNGTSHKIYNIDGISIPVPTDKYELSDGLRHGIARELRKSASDDD